MENVKIHIDLKNKENLLANATISLDTVEFGQITIKNFQIWKSKNFNSRLQANINIAPPSIRAGFRKYLALVFFEKENLWFEIERFIYSKYIETRIKNDGLKEDINPEDIPI